MLGLMVAQQEPLPTTPVETAGIEALLGLAVAPFGTRFPHEMARHIYGTKALHPTPSGVARLLAATGFPHQLHTRLSADDIAHQQLPLLVWPRHGKTRSGPLLRMPTGHWYASDASPCDPPRMDHAEGLTLSGPPTQETAEPTRLGDLLRTFRHDLPSIALYGILIHTASLAIPLFSMTVYDRVLPVGAERTLWLLALGVGLVLTLDVLLRLLRGHLLSRMVIRAAQAQDTPLLETLLRQRGTGTRWADQLELMRLAHDIREQMILHVLPTLTDIPFVLLFLFAIGLIAPSLLPVPLVLIALALAIQAGLLPTLRRMAMTLAHTTHRRTRLLLEILRSAPASRLANRQHEALNHWEVQAAALHQAEAQGHFWNGLGQHLTITIAQLSFVATLIAGADLVMRGQLTVGALIAVSLLSSRAITPALHLIDTAARLQGIAAHTTLLKRGLTWPTETLTVTPETPETLATCHGEILLQHVDVSGPRTGLAPNGEAVPLILQDINLHILPQQRWAVVGGVGAGKSSLLHLLCGLLEPQHGEVRLDGVAYHRMPVSELRRHVALVSQTPVFADLTVREIICGLQPMDEPRLQEALAASGFGSVLSQQGSGLEFRAGPNAERLSGGQRQMLALATAFYRVPRVLLLDEPSSPFDSETERLLVQNLTLWLKRHPTTLVMVSHREPMLALVDHMLVLSQGRVVATGTKAQVLADMKKQATARGKVAA